MSLRQHWKLVTAGLVFVLVLMVGFGGVVVRPTITSALSTKEQLTENISGSSDFFDSGTHTIEISYDETEYQEMVREFQDSGEKNVVKANITIDGTEIPEVGIRLKGNSTLMSLRGDDSRGAGPGDGQQNRPGTDGGTDGGTTESTGNAATVEPVALQQGTGSSDGTAGQDDGTATGAEPGGGMGGGQTQLSFDDPQSLPWLVSFDEYQEGRAYEGNTEISLRPATNGSSTAVNEALALAMTAESGQPTQDYTVASVSVNGGESTSRIVVDIPDGQWANELGNGVLYKASAEGSMDYVGDDPTDYEDSYTQINAVGNYDLQPVMEFLDFVNNSTDEEFAADLDQHLDIESFAKYLATQSLISNSDAMDGPGNNYYLWYDTDDDKFSVLSWDLNMALSGMGGGMGGGMPTQGTVPQGSGADQGTDQGTVPEGTPEQGQMPQMPGQLQGGGQFPQMPGMPGDTRSGDSAQSQSEPQQQDGDRGTDGGGMPAMPDGNQAPGGDGESQGGGAGRGSSILKERFLANEDFATAYQDAYAELYDTLIASGYAQETLDAIVARATSAGDTGASSLGETIATKLEQTSATSTAEEALNSSMGGGRRQLEQQEGQPQN